MPTRVFTKGEPITVRVAILPDPEQLVQAVGVADVHPAFSATIGVQAHSNTFATTFWVPVSELVPDPDGQHGVLRATVAKDKEAYGDLVYISIRGVRVSWIVPRSCVTQVNLRSSEGAPEDLEAERAELRRLAEAHGFNLVPA
jgi:hypothetical protein